MVGFARKGALVHAHTRREFLSLTLGAAWLGASVLERAALLAADARAQSTRELPTLFDLEKITDGVYGAIAHGRALINSNSVIFENTDDVLIVDAQASPSAVHALVAQIRREITRKPVRYVVATHLHGDHTQGLLGHRQLAPDVRIISSVSTFDRLSATGAARLKSATDGAERSLANFQEQLSTAKTPDQKAYWAEMISQTRAFIEETRNIPLELPNVTVDDHLIIHDRAHELRVFYGGRGHTAGDLFVFCPEKKTIATGDMLHSFFPFIGDGYPSEWPVTLRRVGELGFTNVVGGHGGAQRTPVRLEQWCRYLEELCEIVTRAREQGTPLERLLETVTPASLKSLDRGGYRGFLAAQVKKYDFRVHLNTPAEVVARYVRENLTAVFRNLGRA
jgi:cyclase